jgi:adenosine deaminase
MTVVHGKPYLNIDTHCHLGGCCPVDFVWKVIRDHGLTYLAESYEDVVAGMTFAPDEPRTFHRFLGKFTMLDHIPWTPELIRKCIEHICADAKADGVDGMFMDFSINKYMTPALKWHKHEAVSCVRAAFDEFWPGRVLLLLSIKYEATQASQRQYAKLLDHPAVQKAVTGIDLVGDEGNFNYDTCKELVDDWVAAKKLVRLHVGEYGPAENVTAAIRMGATNIAHGVKVAVAEEIADELKQVSYDLAISSNYATGVLPRDRRHPVTDMLQHGFKLTIGSDDPVPLGTTLSQEYDALVNDHGVSAADVMKLRQAGVDMFNYWAPEAISVSS